MYLLNRGHYHLTLCKMQTKSDQIKELNIEIRNLHKICESFIYNKPIKDQSRITMKIFLKFQRDIAQIGHN